MDLLLNGIGLTSLLAIGFALALFVMIARFFRRATQGQALVRTGPRKVSVAFTGMMVYPVIHRLEIMDISLKTIVISRIGKDGLVCKDNMRADIKVAFFVRVNAEPKDVQKVAQTVGCARASSKEALVNLFEAKFSEALKTVGKAFTFEELYVKRTELRSKIIEIIGRDLNGYALDDVAIDYLEQTPLVSLDATNILDAEGIKKITEITSRERILSNEIERNQEKVIKQQNVEAREAILELEKQLAETEERQKREVAAVKAREEAEAAKVQEEERKKAQSARIATDEELRVAEENMERQVIIAEKNKLRTAAVETERVEKDRALEATERERIVTLAQIEKEKAVEEERKNIQEVIRERVSIEKTVVVEEEGIKDTRALAEAERQKQVAVLAAEQIAEAALVEEIKGAEAAKQASEHKAKQLVIEAEAEQASASQRADAIKTMAEAEAAQAAALGLADAQVMEAKAAAHEKQGDAEASIIEAKAEAEAKGIEVRALAQAKADTDLGLAGAKVEREQGAAEAEVIASLAEANEKKGLIDAKVMEEKLRAEAQGISEKAEAMKQLDGVGKEHEEFKLKLQMERDVELANVHIRKDIADAQAKVLGTALQTAKIDIVGGESVFFDKIVNAISNGKALDRTIANSQTLSAVKEQLLDGDESLLDKIKGMVKEYNIDSEDLKNLSISALILRMMTQTQDDDRKGLLQQMHDLAKQAGVADKTPGSLGLI